MTGAAALVASAFPNLTAAQIKQRILNGVDPIGQIGDNSLKPTLTNGRLNVALEDRLHQPQRIPLYPWVEAVMEAAGEAGAYGSALAGAGPSVVAFCERHLGVEVAEAMTQAAPAGGRGIVTRVTPHGLEAW